jgi:hypothetical protein
MTEEPVNKEKTSQPPAQNGSEFSFKLSPIVERSGHIAIGIFTDNEDNGLYVGNKVYEGDKIGGFHFAPEVFGQFSKGETVYQAGLLSHRIGDFRLEQMNIRSPIPAEHKRHFDDHDGLLGARVYAAPLSIAKGKLSSEFIAGVSYK